MDMKRGLLAISRTLIIAPLALFGTTSCHGQNQSSKVSEWWYSAQPEDFQDQSIGGGGRPRQASTSTNTGMRAGGKR